MNTNSTAYGGDSFYCLTGYIKIDSICVKDVKENAIKVGSTWSCNTGYVSLNDRCVNYDTYCSIKFVNTYFYSQSLNSCAFCPSGYKYDYVTSQCKTREQLGVGNKEILHEQANIRLNRKRANMASLGAVR